MMRSHVTLFPPKCRQKLCASSINKIIYLSNHASINPSIHSFIHPPLHPFFYQFAEIAPRAPSFERRHYGPSSIRESKTMLMGVREGLVCFSGWDKAMRLLKSDWKGRSGKEGRGGLIQANVYNNSIHPSHHPSILGDSNAPGFANPIIVWEASLRALNNSACLK